jgi:hypothetical protein
MSKETNAQPGSSVEQPQQQGWADRMQQQPSVRSDGEHAKWVMQQQQQQQQL